MRCQCLVSNLLRRYVGKCGEYVVVKVRRSPASCFLFVAPVRTIQRVGQRGLRLGLGELCESCDCIDSKINVLVKTK